MLIKYQNALIALAGAAIIAVISTFCGYFRDGTTFVPFLRIYQLRGTPPPVHIDVPAEAIETLWWLGNGIGFMLVLTGLWRAGANRSVEAERRRRMSDSDRR